MRFAVDAHAIGRHLTGNERYVRSLLRGFADLDQESDFVTYLSVMQAEASMPARFSVRRVAANPFMRLGCDLAGQLRHDRPDLIHVQYTAPLGCPVPVVVTVHDVSFLECPDYFQRTRAAQLRWSVKRTVQRAARILTVSEFSRTAIAKAYGLDESNIVVVPNAAAEGFMPVNRAAAATKVRDAFGLAAPFIFSVGDLQPRKNHIGMIAAFRDLLREVPNLPHTLVIAGKETWFSARVHEAARQSGVADRIRFLGFVSDEDLLQLYNACELFCFPSYYEGFGLPVVEAMACGRAVVCSNTSAVPEVADGAALLFDPYRPEEIARAMADMIRNPEMRARRERLSLQRATHFSWRQSARQTLEVYYEVAEGRQARAKAAHAVTSLR